MPSTAIDRRRLLRLAAVLPSLPSQARPAAAPAPLYLGGRVEADGSHAVGGFSASGARLLHVPLPARGHGFALRPGTRQAVVFARRPGRFALVFNLVFNLAFDLARGAVECAFATPEERHFYGHGVFCPDGRLLYASENDFAGERGVIGIYDAARSYARVGELASHGIGPHELALLSDGTTLAVAHGGILTHPSLPRVALNPASMAPALCYLDRHSGALVRECRFGAALDRLSIRHLAVGAGDRVALAMQWRGPGGRIVPLAASHDPRSGQGLWPLAAPPQLWRAMRHYGGSVCFDGDGRGIAVSAPRAGLIAFWDGAGAHRFTAALADGCGVAPGQGPGAFLASGSGVLAIDSLAATSARLPGAFAAAGRWDNHLAAAPPP